MALGAIISPQQVVKGSFIKIIKDIPYESYWNNISKKKNPFSPDCPVLVCLLMRSFHRLYSFPLFFIKAAVWQFKNLLSHIKAQMLVPSQQPVISDISHNSQVWFTQTKILHNPVDKISKICKADWLDYRKSCWHKYIAVNSFSLFATCVNVFLS